MYRELLITPAALHGQRVWPDDARRLVARACDGTTVSPGIFNRDPDGKTLQGVFGHTAEGEGYGRLPGILFDGGEGFVRLFGMGSGARVLSENSAAIAQSVSDHLGGSLYRFDMREGKCLAAESRQGNPRLYFVRLLFVSKKLDHYQDIVSAHDGKPPLETLAPLIKRVITRGLISQAMTLDEADGQHRAAQIPDDDTLDIQLFEGIPTFLPINRQTRTLGLGVKGLIFSMNLELSGPWFVGTLRSRGYGLIRRAYGGRGRG